ncbi:MAG: hypothetical protein CMN75_01570 [Spirochaeta sp.]|nr:hypothetical protein [Spirochaeta sp.]
MHRTLLCCLSLASAQQRTLKAKAWFGKSNNRKQSVPLSQHDGNADEPYLVHDVAATKQTAITHDRFHGLYPCQIGTPCPSYSAAFLASRLQVVDNVVTPNRMKRRNTNMESASYHMMGHRHAYDVWRTVDAFDYAVEHLSMYERMMHASKSGKDKGSALGDVLYGTFVDNLAKYEKRLKEKCGGDDPALRKQKRFTDAERTVGVMPFFAAGVIAASRGLCEIIRHRRHSPPSAEVVGGLIFDFERISGDIATRYHTGKAGHGGDAEIDPMHGLGSGHTRYESKALYLNITIRSIRCHFGAVAVSALDPRDRAYLEKGVGLPIIDDVLWVDHLPVNKPSFLGVATIREIQRRWTNESTALWRSLDFVHYTEADQILHMRPKHRHKLYQVLKSSEKGGAWKGGRMSILTPHRLNAIPRAQDVEFLRKAFDPPAYGNNLPEDVSDEVLRDLESQAAVIRKEEYQLPSAYEPRRDPWHTLVFGTVRGAWVRRELDGYGAKKTLELDDELRYGSCCYLKKGETSYPYDERGKRGGTRVDDSTAGTYLTNQWSNEDVDRPSPVEVVKLGDHALGILAGLCCHICARRGRLGRHCDNYCAPAAPGEEDCAVGEYAD